MENISAQGADINKKVGKMNFNWHELDDRGFLSWMIVELLGENKDISFDEISERSDNFKNVELAISINGIPVKSDVFVQRIEQIMDDNVGREAQKLVNDMAPDLTALHDDIGDLQHKVHIKINEFLEANGLSKLEEDYY